MDGGCWVFNAPFLKQPIFRAFFWGGVELSKGGTIYIISLNNLAIWSPRLLVEIM